MTLDANTSWRQLITKEMDRHGDTWDAVEWSTFKGDQLDRQFDNGYGYPEGASFTLWTQSRVYFPAMYDGAEWAASVPRNPCAEAVDHIGG